MGGNRRQLLRPGQRHDFPGCGRRGQLCRRPGRTGAGGTALAPGCASDQARKLFKLKTFALKSAALWISIQDGWRLSAWRALRAVIMVLRVGGVSVLVVCAAPIIVQRALRFP